MLWLIIATLVFLLIVVAVRIAANTMVFDERFIGGGIPWRWWVFIVVGAALLAIGWVQECQAQTPDSIKTKIALDIIRVAQWNYDPEILKMNPLSMETHEQVRYKRAVGAEKYRLFLVMGLLELYEMKLLTQEYHRARQIEMYKAKLRSRTGRRYCPDCGFSHGRFYHAMIGKE